MTVWKPVVGYENHYEISDDGQIRSIDRYVVHPRGSLMLRRGFPMKINKNKLGYMDVKLSKNSVETSHLIHRLVAKAFLENPENKPQINHKNGCKHDNSLENLEWSTVSENRFHAYQELNADCWLRHIKGNNFFVTNGARTRRIVGHYVLPDGWKYGRHNGGRISNRSAA